MKAQFYLLVLYCIVLVMVGGCSVGSKQEGPGNYFMLEVQRQGASEPMANSVILMVQPFLSSPGINQRELVYRRSLSRYESDYYERFVADVGGQVAEQTRRWLSLSGCCAHVLPLGSSADATHLLEGNVAKLHSDFRDAANPQAVMEVDFFLIDIRSRKPTVTFQGTYSATTDLSEATAEAIITAYNQCLRQILTQLEIKLRQTDFTVVRVPL